MTHGALHFLERNNEAYKIIRNEDFSLKSMRDYLLYRYEDLGNLLVFNATNKEKLNEIYANKFYIRVMINS